MEKILIEVYVPSILETFDIFVPQQCMVYELLILISQAIENITSDRYVNTPESMLCYRSNGEILDINATADEAGIRNGIQLMLI